MKTSLWYDRDLRLQVQVICKCSLSKVRDHHYHYHYYYYYQQHYHHDHDVSHLKYHKKETKSSSCFSTSDSFSWQVAFTLFMSIIRIYIYQVFTIHAHTHSRTHSHTHLVSQAYEIDLKKLHFTDLSTYRRCTCDVPYDVRPVVCGTEAYGAPACSGKCATFSGITPKGTGNLRFKELASACTAGEPMERPEACGTAAVSGAEAAPVLPPKT